MGLDTVGLVLETEDRFKTSIPDVFAERIQTIGQLHEFLMTQIRWKNLNRCTSAAMFYAIRRLLVANFGAQRTRIRPPTLLSKLIAPPMRYRFWQDVQINLLTVLPSLRRSKMFMWQGDLFPAHVATVGDLASICAGSLQITSEYTASDDAAVWHELCELIGRFAGVAPSHFNRKRNS